MSGSFYERVRAAYGLQDDEDLRELAISSPVRQEFVVRIPSVSLRAPQPSPPSPPPPEPLEPIHLEKVNSVRVPFDPEDQSDDEVIITTAYKRKQAPAAAKTLSPTAAPFQPKNSTNPNPKDVAQEESAVSPEPAPPPKPLVAITSAKATSNEAADLGMPYPGHRVGFCPWLLVVNYHLWFVGRQNSELIKPYFEEAALLQAQDWDFCYLWQPAKEGKNEQQQQQQQQQQHQQASSKHVLLVPTAQIQHFLSRINQTLGIQLIIPPGPTGEKFCVIFGQQKTPIPRFLGRARDTDTFASLLRNIPALNPRDSTDRMKPQAKKSYERKVAGLVLRYDKNKADQKKAKAERTRLKHQRERQQVGRQIKRIQRYVGLRPKAGQGSLPTPPGALDLTQPPPHAPEGDVIFVSMDIESYEYHHEALTEIGFGILDTRDIVGVAPGAQCEHWFERIQARHLRIREHISMVNRHFVKGCEDNFNFGASEFVALDDVLRLVTDILQPGLISGEPRKVVLLGHDTKSDIGLIANVGFIVKDGMFLEILDTQDLHQHYRMRAQQMGLRGVLGDLEIEYSFLHNGGNDAVYTLQAMLVLAVMKRQDSLRRQNERMKPNYAVDPEVIAHGWASGGEDSDGGVPEKKGSGDAALEAGAEEDVTTNENKLPHNQPTVALGDSSEDLINL